MGALVQYAVEGVLLDVEQHTIESISNQVSEDTLEAHIRSLVGLPFTSVLGTDKQRAGCVVDRVVDDVVVVH